MKQNKAFVFNAYGALLDTYIPFNDLQEQLGENALVIYKLWRAKRLQYSSQLNLMNQHTNYEKIRRYALDFACDVYGVNDESIKANLLEAQSKLDCYPDVKQSLEALKANNKLTAVLSNGTPQKLSSAVKHAGIDHLLDGIYSTDQIGSYKPSPAVYEFLEEQLALPRKQICFISSNSWDIAGAVSYGFNSVWINRYGRKPERLPFKADVEIDSLEKLMIS